MTMATIINPTTPKPKPVVPSSAASMAPADAAQTVFVEELANKHGAGRARAMLGLGTFAFLRILAHQPVSRGTRAIVAAAQARLDR